jgi:hypothetical protein
MLRHSLVFRAFDLVVAGAVELENTEENGMRAGFAFNIEGGYELPTAIKDRLSLGLSWASGDGSSAAYFPIVREAESVVLKPCLSGIMIIKANYEARLVPSLSFDLGALYLIRNDSKSFTDPYLEDDSYPLGLEIDAGLRWVPLSDLGFYLKGGVFLPQTGSAWKSDAPVQWRITAGAIFSF